MKRSSISIALSMLAVFLSGSLVGAFAHKLYTARTVVAAPPPRSPAEFRQRYLTEMKDRLHLNEDQAARLNAVLDQTRQRFREFNEKHKPEMEAIHEAQVREINAMLDENQQQLYAQYREERAQRRKEHEKHR